MIIDFQQGIVTYPTVSNRQVFLSRNGAYISLSTANGRVDVTFSHGAANYYHTEEVDVARAWGPLENNQDYWLYWDIDVRTAERSFGTTTLQPIYSHTVPTTPAQGQHWFNTVTKKMHVFVSDRFREVIRVFAAKVNNSVFTPLGSVLSRPFSGTQAGLTVEDTAAGHILVDSNGLPIRRTDGTFVTSETQFFVDGVSFNSTRLESNILHAAAAQNIAKYQVVAMSDFDEVRVAQYNDLQSESIAIALSSAATTETAELCVQGVVTNTSWSWPVVGQALWIDDTGTLTPNDPHLVDPVTYPEGKPPVARVFSPTTIFFDQGLGGKGAQGDTVIVDTVPATTTVLGTVRLSVPPLDATSPVVVGTNDPRLTNARTPLPHTHPASAVSTTPYGPLAGTSADIQIKELADLKASVTSVQSLQDQVDNLRLVDLADVQISSPTDGYLVAWDAATSRWVSVEAPFSKSIVWNQSWAATTWTIVHNMDNNYPVLSFFNASEAKLEPTNITIVDANTITATFASSTAGRAHIVFADPTDRTAPVATGSTLNFCGTPTVNQILGSVAAVDNVGVTGYRFATSTTSTSFDGYIQIASNGQVTITAAGIAAMPINNTYSVQARDAAGHWSTPANIVVNVEEPTPVEGAGDGELTYTPTFQDTFTGAAGTLLYGGRTPDLGPAWNDPSALPGDIAGGTGPLYDYQDAVGNTSWQLTGDGYLAEPSNNDAWPLHLPVLTPTPSSYLRFGFKINKLYANSYWQCTFDIYSQEYDVTGTTPITTSDEYGTYYSYGNLVFDCYLGYDWSAEAPEFYYRWSVGEFVNVYGITMKPVLGHEYTTEFRMFEDKVQWWLTDVTSGEEYMLVEEAVDPTWWRYDNYNNLKFTTGDVFQDAWADGVSNTGNVADSFVHFSAIELGVLTTGAGVGTCSFS